ncbi:MAG: hypothetical protein RR239_04955 [Oscillospiraceae bacterium]
MTTFLIIYILLAAAAITVAFFLSINEQKHKAFKNITTVLYIITILGVLFATGCLETKYSMSRVYSTAIAAAIVLMLYLADSVGGKIKKSNK